MACARSLTAIWWFASPPALRQRLSAFRLTCARTKRKTFGCLAPLAKAAPEHAGQARDRAGSKVARCHRGQLAGRLGVGRRGLPAGAARRSSGDGARAGMSAPAEPVLRF